MGGGFMGRVKKVAFDKSPAVDAADKLGADRSPLLKGAESMLPENSILGKATQEPRQTLFGN